MSPRRFYFSVVSLVLSLFVGGCNKPGPGAASPKLRDGSSNQGSYASEVASTREDRRALLLRRIRDSDPQKATIERAVMNDKNELGLILNHHTSLDEVPKLVKAILTQMAQIFPDQDLTVVAYTPTEPPHTVGTGHLNAQTRDMTYQPATP